MRARTERFLLSLVIGASLTAASPTAGVTIEWVTVGDPNNPADTQVMHPDGTTGYGSVPYAYQISKYEVTNSLYAEFLNAVAPSDYYELYDSRMSSSPYGGITQSGSIGSFSYGVKSGFEQKPVDFVSFNDAAFFANWLNNGQPVQTDPSEFPSVIGSGSYDFNYGPSGIVTRSPGATVFVPSEDEWYKAAYYDASSSSYFTFPMASTAYPSCAPPTAAPDSANCNDLSSPIALTDVGSYPGSPGPYGTFDQGGNVAEWTEAGVNGGSEHVFRGGSFNIGYGGLAAISRDWYSTERGHEEHGFRVVLVPEPGTGFLIALGLLALAAQRRLH